MRLIDAEYLVNLIKAGNYCDDLGQIVQSIGEKEVNEAPTIEAIPIDWLRKYVDEHDEIVEEGLYWIVEEIIDDWEKENDLG